MVGYADDREGVDFDLTVFTGGGGGGVILEFHRGIVLKVWLWDPGKWEDFTE